MVLKKALWTDGPMHRRTDGPTDVRTDRPSYRDVTSHLKTWNVGTLQMRLKKINEVKLQVKLEVK